jgi:hypothetical protein
MNNIRSIIREEVRNILSETISGESLIPNKDVADEIVFRLMSEIPVPYVKAYTSSLGGPHRMTVMLTVSFDPKEEWSNNILENSMYFKMIIGYDGKMELFSGPSWRIKKFRKTRAKSIDDAIFKIKRYVLDVTALTGE